MHSTAAGSNESQPGPYNMGETMCPGCPKCLTLRRKPKPAENVVRLLALREVCPGACRPVRRREGKTVLTTIFGTEPGSHATLGEKGAKHCCGPGGTGSEKVKKLLLEWVEADSMQRCSAQYCPLNPAPRSTIAAAFSPDGATLASTHGDHTVKIICCRTGQCLKVLTGHRRTPWVVRYHPTKPTVLASGSLDHEVRLWDSETGNCIASHDFYRPIASLAFHAGGEVVAVASGHTLYLWKYGQWGDEPTIVLRTRRSLRAVHFHPNGAPLLLTAEVNGLEVSDAAATSGGAVGYLNYPQPAVYFTPGLAAAAAAATTAAAELAYQSYGHQSLTQNQNQNQNANPYQNQGEGWGGGLNRNDSQNVYHNQLQNINLNLGLNHPSDSSQVGNTDLDLNLNLNLNLSSTSTPSPRPPGTGWLWPESRATGEAAVSDDMGRSRAGFQNSPSPSFSGGGPTPMDVSNQATPTPPTPRWGLSMGMGGSLIPSQSDAGAGREEGGGRSNEGTWGAAYLATLRGEEAGAMEGVTDTPEATGNPSVENSFWMGLGHAWDGSQAPMEEEGGQVGRELEAGDDLADWGEVPSPGMDLGRRSPTVVWDIGGPVAEPLEEEGGRGEGDAVAGGYWGTADTGVHPIGGLWWQGAATAGGEGSMHTAGESGGGGDAASLGLSLGEMEANLMQAMQQQHDWGGGEYSSWEIPFLQGWVQGHARAGMQGAGGEQLVSQDSFNFQEPRQPSAFGRDGSGGDGSGWAAGGAASAPSGSVASVAMAAAVAAARAAALAGAGVVGAAGAGLGAGLGAQIGAAGALGGNAPPGGGAGGGFLAGLQAGMVPFPSPAAFNGLPAGTFPWMPGGAFTGMPGVGYANLLEPAGAGGVTSAAELPCTVKVRLWPHDINNSNVTLEPDTCRLTIPHAVLCSEMGAHFSPCGRFLAACVACVPQSTDGEGSWPHPAPSCPDSPTHHTTAAQQLICELRVYSLEDSSFGEVVASRVVRAAHCLTSIQFSPASDHILLSYGRRHSSLLRSLVADGTSLVPLYTTIEEGKLRIVRHQRSAAQPLVARALEDEILHCSSAAPPITD